MKNLITKKAADLDSPCRELSNGGLESVVKLLVSWKINLLSAQTLTLNPAVVKPDRISIFVQIQRIQDEPQLNDTNPTNVAPK